MASETNAVRRPTIRMVPKPNVSADDLAGVANEENWRLVRVINGDRFQPAEDIYETQDGKATIHWIEDPRIGMPYIAILGDDRDSAAMLVRRELATKSLGEIRDPDEEVRKTAERLLAACLTFHDAKTSVDPSR